MVVVVVVGRSLVTTTGAHKRAVAWWSSLSPVSLLAVFLSFPPHFVKWQWWAMSQTLICSISAAIWWWWLCKKKNVRRQNSWKRTLFDFFHLFHFLSLLICSSSIGQIITTIHANKEKLLNKYFCKRTGKQRNAETIDLPFTHCFTRIFTLFSLILFIQCNFVFWNTVLYFSNKSFCNCLQRTCSFAR